MMSGRQAALHACSHTLQGRPQMYSWVVLVMVWPPLDLLIHGSDLHLQQAALQTHRQPQVWCHGNQGTRGTSSGTAAHAAIIV